MVWMHALSCEQLTDQACIHTINPYGILPEQKKNQEKLKKATTYQLAQGKRLHPCVNAYEEYRNIGSISGCSRFSLFLQFLPTQDAPRQSSCAPVGAQAQAEQTI